MIYPAVDFFINGVRVTVSILCLWYNSFLWECMHADLHVLQLFEIAKFC